MYGVTLILVLAVVGGVIAFIGDRLGTRIGKKKLTLFGLRPRHTAVVVTIFTGVCITTVTFGILAAASENVRTALFGMDRLNAMIADTRAALDETASALTSAEDAKQQADAELAKSEEEIAGLRSEQDDLRAESDRLSAGNRALMMEKEGLISLNGRLSGENAKLLTDIDELGVRANVLREGNIVYQAGEIIASGTIPAGLTRDEVERGLEGIAQLGTRNASTRLGENHTDQDIWIYGPQYESAVQTIMNSPVNMVVRIVAAGNLVRGDEIRATIELYPNRIIYRGGELIAARVCAPEGQGPAAEEAVVSFLRDVNAAASAKGILPDPIRGTVGVIEGAEFYGLVQELMAHTGNVILSAYAAADTDAMGPLRLRFKVESESGS